jgi:hypothetical protein
MSQNYYIVNWDQHYEVDSHGKPWEPGQPFRKGPLEYLRVKTGRDWSIEEIELHEQLGDEMYAAFAVFTQLCRFVGDEPRCRREGGIIRSGTGAAATDEDLMRMLRLSAPAWKKVAAALCHPHVHWLSRCDEAAASSPDLPAARQGAGPLLARAQTPELPEKAETPGIPGFPGTPGIPLSSQVKSRQSKTKQVESTSAVSLSQIVADLLPQRPPARPDERPEVVRDSTRLGFLHEMRQTLRARELADCRTVTNFEQWVWENVSSGRAGPDLLLRSLTIARDCVHGERPVAVFLSRVKQELGYVAPSRRTAAPFRQA